MDGKLDIKDFKIVAMILTLFSLVAVGFIVNSKIQESVMDEVELYRKAIKLENKKEKLIKNISLKKKYSLNELSGLGLYYLDSKQLNLNILLIKIVFDS